MRKAESTIQTENTKPHTARKNSGPDTGGYVGNLAASFVPHSGQRTPRRDFRVWADRSYPHEMHRISATQDHTAPVPIGFAIRRVPPKNAATEKGRLPA